MKYTEYNEAIVSQVWFGNAYFLYHCQKILELSRNNPLILTRPTPVIRKIHKMGVPLFSFQPRTPHDPVTPLEKLLSRSNTFFVFLRAGVL
jgi:hypothetical protein